ncbi:hypothetical protein SAMN05444337_2409 [Flavobacterium haoranii]|uniref:Histidyl-tRNA synthetase n=2 Tax=Flavobacterium haoranii TaxID=683124 RepID=A0A1M6L7P8_9FLAO|nr:hypothetical protein SAMN05444337_2409 [Flavobacterium haoranii]
MKGFFYIYDMKYARLTKEQLEELHPEFITFLATQSIDKQEWDDLKENKPQVALQEIDVFSDMIWERALTNVRFIDHFSNDYIFLFKCFDDVVLSYVINSVNSKVDFLTKEGINWLSENLSSDEVVIQKGKKDISNNRNEALFEIIKQGGLISKGELYSKLEILLNQ